MFVCRAPTERRKQLTSMGYEHLAPKERRMLKTVRTSAVKDAAIRLHRHTSLPLNSDRRHLSLLQLRIQRW